MFKPKLSDEVDFINLRIKELEDKIEKNKISFNSEINNIQSKLIKLCDHEDYKFEIVNYNYFRICKVCGYKENLLPELYYSYKNKQEIKDAKQLLSDNGYEIKD